MPEVSLRQWNGFLQDHPNAHFLQTGEWGELKSDFGWRTARLIVDGIGAQLLFRKLPLGLTVGYIPKAQIPSDSSVAGIRFWGEVDQLCKDRRAILCKLECDEWVTGSMGVSAHGAAAPAATNASRLSLHSVQPRRTIIVDLHHSENVILERMKQKCRYNIRVAQKKGISVHIWDDVAAFHSMMVTTGDRNAFDVHSAAYYRRAYELFHGIGACELLVARYAERPLAALMVFARGRRAWYVYGGSTDLERERMPNYLLQWEAMRWAKGRGCEEYDLWGIPDQDEATLEADFADRQDGLWGVYRFKRGFGGEMRRRRACCRPRVQ